MYADYAFYREKWMGSLEEAAFSALELRAASFVREITFNRIKEVSEDVQYATCAVIDCLNKWQKTEATLQENAGKKSESVGKYSVTYNTEALLGAEPFESMTRKRAYAAAYPYLVHTGLLYRGVSPCKRTRI